MDLSKFVEAVENTELPFVFGGIKLNSEECKKAIKMIGVKGTILGAILGDNIAVGLEGLAITEQGIWFYIGSGRIGALNIPRIQGVWLFEKFMLHTVNIKKNSLSEFAIEFILWDIVKKKSVVFNFRLEKDKLNIEESMTKELEDIFKTLTTKTGTEFEQETVQDIDGHKAKSVEKDPNTFDFEYNNVHTMIVLQGNVIIIKKFKIDDKTRIQTPQGDPVSIPRSAVASVRKGRSFSPLTALKLIGAGVVLWLSLGLLISSIVGFIAFLLCAGLGFSMAFPKMLIITRKDNIKFKARFYDGDVGIKEYERFIKVVF